MDSLRESESLLEEVDYQQLVRCDSLLGRMGSGNFASLIETPSHPLAGEEELSHLESQFLPSHQSQFPQDLHAIVNDHTSMQNGAWLDSSDLAFQDGGTWAKMEDLLEDIPPENTLEYSEDKVYPVDGTTTTTTDTTTTTTTTTTSMIPDSTPKTTVPSLQVWPGQYDFTLGLPVGNKDKNKWCYSSMQNKLYLDSFITVPIHVNLSQWINASITITPVFKGSNHRVDPVIPCFLCKKKVNNNELENYMVLVEGQACEYKQVDGRYVVTVPLHPPPPGEASSILLVKLSCLTSCSGGPNRRPFCMVFTLHDGSGGLIGRQVLDIKGCKCPSRDMLNEDKTALKRQQHSHPANNSLLIDSARTLKRSVVSVTTTDVKKKKRINIKPEPGTEEDYATCKIPLRFVDRVKAYVKHLRIEEYIEKHDPMVLMGAENELQVSSVCNVMSSNE